MHERGELKVPAINVNDSVTKSKFDTCTAAANRWPMASSAPPTYGRRQSCGHRRPMATSARLCHAMKSLGAR